MIMRSFALSLFFTLAASACHTSGAGTDAGVCIACVTSADCGTGVCAQLGGDSYCATTCTPAAGCGGDETCAPVVDVTGAQVSVCVSSTSACAASTTGGDDLGMMSGVCGTLVGPTLAASCASCAGQSSCQANGCYGGWWCNTASNRCQAPPATCDSSGSDGGASGADGGAPVTGTVTAAGGSVSRLLFAIVGDTRPPYPDDTAGYPTGIITTIFGDVQALSPRPSFVVTTGDYMFAGANGTQGVAQLDKYLAARAGYAGVLFPALGNHECTGATASNCGSGATDGITANYTAFMTKLLGPINQTSPYYSIPINASDGSWTAKLVFIAANAWSSTQASWLESTLAQPTTYTFIMRHEPHAATTAPGVTPSEAVMARHPYTLAFVGHTHTYEHLSPREVIIGNGGAPISGNRNYGYGLASQRPDGAIQVDVID